MAAVSASFGCGYRLLGVPVTRGDRAALQQWDAGQSVTPPHERVEIGVFYIQGLAAKFTPNHTHLPPETCPAPAPGREAGTDGGDASPQQAGGGAGDGEAVRETEAGAQRPAGLGAPRPGEGEGAGLKAGGSRGGAALSQGACAALRRCCRSGLGQAPGRGTGLCTTGSGRAPGGSWSPLLPAAAAACSALAAREGWRGRRRWGRGRAFAPPPSPAAAPLLPLASPPRLPSACQGLLLA